MRLPAPFADWFAARGWRLRRHQADMLAAGQNGEHALLVAATGAGKTLSGFLPSLVDLAERPTDRLHTLYVSPLKALAADVERNLLGPIADMELDISVESRSGDTSSDKKARQRSRPPNILLTTPESLSLLLSYPDSFTMFADLKTVVIDEIVQRCVRDGIKNVLNLAAGLDARPYRLDLPPSLRWLHVDMPDMVAYYRERMAGEAPRCELEFIEADLRIAGKRREVFAYARAQGPLLVISEGLLIYLEAPQVTELARDLHDVAQARWWIADLASPMLLKFLERTWARRLRDGNAPFLFGPAEGTTFFSPLGWREVEFRSTWDESLRVRRTMRGAHLWHLLYKFQSARRREAGRRMSGIVLFESDGKRVSHAS